MVKIFGVVLYMTMDNEYRLSTNKYTFSLDSWIRFLPEGESIIQYSMPWYYDVPFANATHLEAYQLKASSERIRAAFELFWTTEVVGDPGGR